MMVWNAFTRATMDKIIDAGDNRRQQELHQHAVEAMGFPRAVITGMKSASYGQAVRRAKIWGQLVSGSGCDGLCGGRASDAVLRGNPPSVQAGSPLRTHRRG